jgi:NAD(P)-dependent dehydrogenase (short-subunit alcohol dehydrogenase family)
LTKRRLKDRVALVTGASRGGGKGIALVLGEEGATVYVTGRSVRGQPTTLDRPGTIDDTAEELTARGGTGIAVRCDHTDDSQVEALFERIRNEHGASTCSSTTRGADTSSRSTSIRRSGRWSGATGT